ncbi:sulfotransferase family protein [Gracilibacillus caseinilyticus]|uniref:Sulfotransferase family protein n=1 Tax=Gracilibacillus caseinilyticus TaxID=2932256 RepID=A0ABY4EX53_9BACI|nr:sulfotransferase family 2 domain-containing protein [Gracilibacillus caseinilyticus]UOQ48616.1 sulfotransferase family protein [Gracilibacillus caseinilyticus]
MLEKQKYIDKLLSWPPPLYDEEFPLIFFWRPKGGCTSLIKWYFYQIGLLQTALDYDPWVHLYREEQFYRQKDYKENVRKELLKGEKKVYKLVRNPYRRAVSSFLSMIGNEQIRESVFPGVNTGISFKQFLHQVKRLGVSGDKIDLHIAEQYEEGEEYFIDRYLKLEDFNEQIPLIEKQFNLAVSPLSEITRSPHHMKQKMKETKEIHFSDVPITIKDLDNIPKYDQFYDEETEHLVADLYAKDFKRFGYAK